MLHGEHYLDPYDYTITGIKQDLNNLSLEISFSESLPSKSRNALLYQGKYNITGEFCKNDINSFNVEAQVRFKKSQIFRHYPI